MVLRGLSKPLRWLPRTVIGLSTLQACQGALLSSLRVLQASKKALQAFKRALQAGQRAHQTLRDLSRPFRGLSRPTRALQFCLRGIQASLRAIQASLWALQASKRALLVGSFISQKSYVTLHNSVQIRTNIIKKLCCCQNDNKSLSSVFPD